MIITPNKVVNAYKKTGLIPIRQRFIQKKNGKWHCCAATALYCATHKVDFTKLSSIKVRDELITNTETWLVKQFNNSSYDSICFVAGFDGIGCLGESSQLGLKCAEAVGLD